MKIQVKDFFEAQHQLPDTEFLVTKACNSYHGHTYKVEVEFEGDELRGGMLVDFKGVKQLIATLDHTAIYQKGNPMIDWIEEAKKRGVSNPKQRVVVLLDPPSSENIAKYLYGLIDETYERWGIRNLIVRVCEGYKGEERASWTTYTKEDYLKDTVG